MRLVDESPGDGDLRAVRLRLADGLPRTDGEVERVRVAAASRAVVLDDGRDGDTVVQVGDRHSLAAKRGVVAL